MTLVGLKFDVLFVSHPLKTTYAQTEKYISFSVRYKFRLQDYHSRARDEIVQAFESPIVSPGTITGPTPNSPFPGSVSGFAPVSPGGRRTGPGPKCPPKGPGGSLTGPGPNRPPNGLRWFGGSTSGPGPSSTFASPVVLGTETAGILT